MVIPVALLLSHLCAMPGTQTGLHLLLFFVDAERSSSQSLPPSTQPDHTAGLTPRGPRGAPRPSPRPARDVPDSPAGPRPWQWGAVGPPRPSDPGSASGSLPSHWDGAAGCLPDAGAPDRPGRPPFGPGNCQPARRAGVPAATFRSRSSLALKAPERFHWTSAAPR